jgi:hypothetical protein
MLHMFKSNCIFETKEINLNLKFETNLPANLADEEENDFDETVRELLRMVIFYLLQMALISNFFFAGGVIFTTFFCVLRTTMHMI